VSLPRLLLVDDSQAILAYETATLSDHYAIVTAKSGRDALHCLGEGSFDAVLLDLSMPEMNGDDVLAAMKVDARLAAIPVIIVSTERDRAGACIEAGAAAYLPKPIRADELRALVDRVLGDARSMEETRNLAVLPLVLGDVRFGVPLESVKHVVLSPFAEKLVTSEGATRIFDFHAEWVALLDLAEAIGVTHVAPPVERPVVILNGEKPDASPMCCLFSFAVDCVEAPDRFRRAAAESHEGPRLFPPEAVLGHVVSEPSQMPIVDPLRLFSPRLLAGLPGAIHRAERAMVPATRP
jgi:CheY-like chemotaxis protein